MRLEDVYYFSIKQQQHPAVFDLAQRAVDESQKTPGDTAEIERRIRLLSRSDGTEHIRQCSNFLAEAATYVSLIDQGLVPHWVPETTYATPDIQYEQSGSQHPDEVKHLNSPRVEHEALASGQQYGGSVDMHYEAGLKQKIEDFVTSARRKFVKFNETVNGVHSSSGTLHLFFSKSIDAGITDGISWERNMKDRVIDIAAPLCGSDIALVVTDIDEQFRS